MAFKRSWVRGPSSPPVASVIYAGKYRIIKESVPLSNGLEHERVKQLSAMPMPFLGPGIG